MNPPASSAKPWVRVPANLGRKDLVLISALLTLASFSAHAKILLSEGFTYRNGPLVTAPATQWQNQEGAAGKIEVFDGKLALKDRGSEVVSALLADRPHTAGTLYAGFTVNFSTLPSSTSHFAAFNAENGVRNLGRLHATTEGAAADSFRIGLSTFMGPLNNTVPVDLNLFQDYRIVLRYEPQFLGVTVWVNPVTEAQGGVKPQESFGTFPSPISSFVFRQNPAADNGFPIMTVDNLVVATTFAEAKEVPTELLWAYTVQNGSATITRYLGGGGPNLVMPETLGGAPVKGFKSGIFLLLWPPLASLTLSSGITNIGQGEFLDSPALTNVTFLGPLKSIPKAAFSQCDSLVSVTYPDTVTSIGDQAFELCSRLRDISLPAGLTNIGTSAFRDCSSLKTNQGAFTIPASVITIGDGAFSRCTSLEAIEVDPQNAFFSSLDGVLLNKTRTILIKCPGAKSGTFAIPESVTTLRSGAFSQCKKLTGVTIPESITALPDYAFDGASSLTRIDLPSGLTSLGSGVFFNAGLTNLSLPAGVKTIPRAACQGCPGLVTVTLPEQITRVEDYAFSGCNNLTEINIPRTVTTLGAYFVSGARLSSINVAELNPSYVSLEGVLFNKTRTALLVYPTAKAGNYQIPDGVRTLGVAVFAGAAFTSIAIPASVTSISERAFESCTQLTELTIPDTVTSLGRGCFQGCSKLSSVRVGRGITTLPSSAFASCPLLSEVKLPDTLRTISEFAFFECPSLHRLTIPASVHTFQRGSIFDRFLFEGTEFLELYFEGNAPSASLQSLVLNPEREDIRIAVYHRAGTTGWQATFAGRPTVFWDPQVATGNGAPGIRDGKFGFTITGAPGMAVAVEACTDLTTPVWVPLGIQVLKVGKSPFVDADGANHPSRYYRFQLP